MSHLEGSDAVAIADLVQHEFSVAKGEIMQKLNEIVTKLDEHHWQVSRRKSVVSRRAPEQAVLPTKLDEREPASSSVQSGSPSSSAPPENAGQTTSQSEFHTDGSSSGSQPRRRSLIKAFTKNVGSLSRGYSAWTEGDHRSAAERRSITARSAYTSEDRTESTAEPGCERCRFLLRRPEFNVFVALMIFINVILIGVEVEFTATVPDSEFLAVFTWANICFTVFFVIELIIRLIGLGPYEFFCGADRFWSILDTLLVALSLIEGMFLMMESSGFESSQFRAFRIMRVARTVRGIRVVRVVRVASSLRTLLFSIVNTLKSLMWTLVLLCLIFYGFGVVLTQVVVDFCKEEQGLSSGTPGHSEVPTCGSAGLAIHWSSLAKSMFTLFKSISNGISWHDAVTPLAEVDEMAVVFFLVFLTFTYFAVLNVVTGVFCQSAIEAASFDKDIAIQAQLQQREEYLKQFRLIFKELDQDDSDQVTQDELESKFREDPRLLAYFDSLGINAADAWTLFKLLDIDYSGCIDIDEFAAGCLNLRGPAKAVQIAKMSYENKIQRNAVLDIGKMLNTVLSQLQLWQQGLSPQPLPHHSSESWLSGGAAVVRSQRLHEPSDETGSPSSSSGFVSQVASPASSELRMRV
eukprot:TRINITY_DN102933_c0_g1_i1.p1 TRINITY_DN102933_c0_g1~~TRINITY_DN102933_c0_g1_i1.p1  ORF type:complete len:634 (-),score=96.61 TRINITY_DN102933_c0_g1_i1:233-2134(-)